VVRLIRTWDLFVNLKKAIVGLRPSFSAQVRFGEPGAPVRLPQDRFVAQTPCATTWVELIGARLYSGNSWILQHL
jgi:hypothetical protein